MRRPLAALLVVFGLLLAGCQTDRAVAQPPVGPLNLSNAGVRGLNAELEDTVRSVALRARCPCGGDHSLDACVRSHTSCELGPRTLSLSAKLVKMGATIPDAEQELANYRASFFGPRPQFELSEGACKGPRDAKVTVVEFSDFECPACGNARLVVESLPEAIPGLRMCFKHFPLKRHLRAFDAAQAAEFAREQGRFWELHDLLFDGQASLEIEDFKKYARILGLDDAALEQAIHSGKYAERVQQSREEGVAAGVNATPSLFINGRLLSLPMDADLIAHSVQDELVYKAGAAHP